MDMINHPAGTLSVRGKKKPALNFPKILVVGHNDYDNRHIKSILSQRYEVVIRKHITEVEQLFPLQDYQLVISEYAPTGVNGSLLLQKIKATTDLPVLILSCFQSEKEIISLYDHGADEVMRIPFLEYEFVSRVHHLLSV